MKKSRLALMGSAALMGAGLIFATGCPDRPLAAPVPIVVSTPTTVISSDLQKKVDVLFLIDNSPSMSPKQEALASQFKNFITVLDKAGADYHVGIATSDCGAQPPPGDGTLSGPLGGKCDSVTGDNGALQAIACSSRGAGDFSGPDIQNICNTVCPTPITPTNGTVGSDAVTSNFIASTGGMSPVTNVPGNDVAGAFACMAFVGDTGCGIEMQLEGMKRALDGTNTVQNADFLRKDALLAVILITDEDDCSTLGKNRLEDDPMTMDCSPGGSASPNWACFNPDYRCYAMGTQCSQPLDQAGPKTGCHERAGGGGMVQDISTYESFLDKLKPGAVLVDAIDSPPNGRVQIDQSDGPGTPGLNRSRVNSACVGPVDPVTGETIVGLPQTRLHDFIQHFGGTEYSVCDITNYPKVLQDVANHIVNKLGKNCLPPLAAFSADGGTGGATPSNQCSVLQTTSMGSSSVAECSTTCCNALASDPNGSMSDPSVSAACAAEKTQPCWCAVKNPTACPSAGSPTLIGVYGGSSGTDSFACQTVQQ